MTAPAATDSVNSTCSAIVAIGNACLTIAICLWEGAQGMGHHSDSEGLPGCVVAAQS